MTGFFMEWIHELKRVKEYLIHFLCLEKYYEAWKNAEV